VCVIIRTIHIASFTRWTATAQRNSAHKMSITNRLIHFCRRRRRVRHTYFNNRMRITCGVKVTVMVLLLWCYNGTSLPLRLVLPELLLVTTPNSKRTTECIKYKLDDNVFDVFDVERSVNKVYWRNNISLHLLCSHVPSVARTITVTYVRTCTSTWRHSVSIK